MANYKYIITEKFNNVSIDEFLQEFHLGNEKIKQLKKTGSIIVNNEIKDLSYILKSKDELVLSNDETRDIIPFKSRLDILYEDDYLLIINKPVGVVVHSDGALNTTNTLANMVGSYYERKGYDIPIRYLHRLDCDTSGIIVFCKDILTMSSLSNELANHNIRRDYLALVSGRYNENEIIDLPIGRDRHVNGKYRVSNTGKRAVTEVEVIKKIKRYTLVRLSLKTGRTHQIRVHMAYKGHPLLGDTLYGGGISLINRQALHSYYLFLKHPILDKDIEIYCKPPKDMAKLMEG